MKTRFIGILLITAAIFFACDLFTIGLGEDVDINPPEVFITSPSPSTTEYKSGDFEVQGTVTDDISSTTVAISIGELVVDAVVEENTWTATVPMDQITGDGEINIKAVATDATQKESAPAYVNVQIDRTSPTVLVTTPQVYSPEPTFSGYIVIQGEAWDSTPLDSVAVEVWDVQSTPSLVASAPAEGDRSWFARISLDTGFTDGVSYAYRVVATDAAGNVNSYHYHASDIWARLPANTLFPAMVDIGKWDQEGTAISNISAADLTSLAGQRLTTDVATTGLTFAYDSNIDKPQITLSNLDDLLPVDQNVLGEGVPILAAGVDDKEGVDETSVVIDITDFPDTGFSLSVPGSQFNSPGGGMYTSFQFDLSGANELSPGRYEGTITVADKKGVSNTLSVRFIVDSGAPKIVSVDPSDQYVGIDASDNVLIRVVIQDDNPGSTFTVAARDITVPVTPLPLTETVTPVSSTPSTDADGDTIYVDTYDITIAAPGVTALSVDFQIDDAAGLVYTSTTEYTVDTTAPSVSFTTPADGAQISGNALTVIGSSPEVDTSVVYVSLQDFGVAAPADYGLWTVADGTQPWSVPQDLSAKPEGDYTLYAVAEDIAGNVSAQASVNFSFDLDIPAVAETNIATTTLQRVSAAYSFTGTSSDSYGVANVTVTQRKDGGTVLTIPNGPTDTSGDSSWSTWELLGLPRDLSLIHI